jgi:hypothetical protein
MAVLQSRPKSVQSSADRSDPEVHTDTDRVSRHANSGERGGEKIGGGERSSSWVDLESGFVV